MTCFKSHSSTHLQWFNSYVIATNVARNSVLIITLCSDLKLINFVKKAVISRIQNALFYTTMLDL